MNIASLHALLEPSGFPRAMVVSILSIFQVWNYGKTSLAFQVKRRLFRKLN